MYYKIKAGRVVGGVEVRVVAEDEPVLPNDGQSVGEFEIRGPWVTGSYYKDEDPARFHDGWLCTGDVGTLDGQGYMTISDRTKDVIKSGGEWISSVELENAVMAHPDVFEAAVIATQTRSGPSGHWWPSSRSPRAQDRPERPARTFLADRVPVWWLPDEWTFIGEIPKTSVGKFDKKVMRLAYADGDYKVQAHLTPDQVSGSNYAVADLAQRLEGVLEELTDMALDALRLASAGDPDLAETGEALVAKRRILKVTPGPRALRRRVA